MGQNELLTTRMWSHRTLGICIRECGHIEHHGCIPTFCKLQNISSESSFLMKSNQLLMQGRCDQTKKKEEGVATKASGAEGIKRAEASPLAGNIQECILSA